MREKGVIHTELETNRMRERPKTKVKPKWTEQGTLRQQQTPETELHNEFWLVAK